MRLPGFLRFLGLCLLVICTGKVACAQVSDHIKPGADTAAITRLILIADKAQDPDSAIALFDNILQLSIDANYADDAFRALITKSLKYYQKGDYQKERNCSIDALRWALKCSQKDATAWSYNNIGDSYLNEGDYIKASENYYKAIDELKKNNVPPTHTTANIYINLGLVNIRLGLPAKALSYFRQAEDISRSFHLDYQLANTLINIGEYYNMTHQPDSAIKYFSEVTLISKKLGKTDLEAEADDDLGQSLIEKGEYREAIPLLQLAISLSENRFPYIVVDASYSLGDALCRTGRYKEAEHILITALEETKKHNLKDNYTECYAKLASFYKTTGNYKKALEFTDSLMLLKDSLTSAEKTNVIGQIEQKYKNAEKNKELIQNQLTIARQNNKIYRKNIWIISISGGVFLLCFILAVIYRNSMQKQRLRAGQIKSLQQENTISILKGVMQGEEKERSRIARELHDGIGGMLSAAMMRFMSIRHENEEITSLPSYREAMNLLDEMGDEIRKTAHNLMPEVLLKQSLPEAIRNYCNNMQKGKTLQIDFQSYGTFDNITQKNKLNIYRIVQETLKNITQHANATHALVQLLQNEHLLTITIEDDGTGFNTEEIKKGIGLHNLETRVNSMAGHFTVESEAGKGTTVYIEFDIHKMTADDNL